MMMMLSLGRFLNLCSLLWLLLPYLPVQSYPYDYDFSVIRSDQSPRALQTSGGNLPDLGGPGTQNCTAVGGTHFMCNIAQKVGSEIDYMDLDITIECYLDQSMGFDFRRSEGCTCSTLLTPSNTSRLAKTCPCLVCPKDFGSSSVSIDCSYLIPNATMESDAPSMVPSPAVGGGGGGGGGVPSAVPPTAGGGGGGGIPLPPTEPPSVGPPSPAGSSTTARRLQQGTTTSAPSPGQIVETGMPTTGGASPTTGGGTASTKPTVVSGTSAPSRGAATTKTNAPTSPGATGTGKPSTAAATPTATTPAPSMPGTSPTSSSSTPTSSMAPSEGPLPDPYIFQTCVSVDCDANCNGTCSLGCDNPTTAAKCRFCEGSVGRPTQAPSGAGGNGGGGVPTIGTSAGASWVAQGGWKAVLAAGATSLALLLTSTV